MTAMNLHPPDDLIETGHDHVSYNTRVFLQLCTVLMLPPSPKESRLSFFDSSVERICNWRLPAYDIEGKPSRIISIQ
jgi:hypothetical protein